MLIVGTSVSEVRNIKAALVVKVSVDKITAHLSNIVFI